MSEGAMPEDLIGRLVSHRGDVDRAPENTLAALEAARLSGARRFEIDLQFSADGVPVLLHDAELGRLLGCQARVEQYTLDQLRRWPVREPQRRGADAAGESLASLGDLVGWLRCHPGLQVFVECKPEAVGRLGVAEVRQRLVTELAPVAGQVVLISFDVELVASVAGAGLAGTGLILPAWYGAWRETAERLAPDWLFINWRKVPADQPLWPGRWRWVAYEVGRARLARELVGRGFALIETMHYGRLVAELGPGG